MKEEFLAAVDLYLLHLGGKHTHTYTTKFPSTEGSASSAGASITIECGFHSSTWAGKAGGAVTCTMQLKQIADVIRDHLTKNVSQLMADG